MSEAAAPARRKFTEAENVAVRILAIAVALLGATYATEVHIFLGVVLFKQQFVGAFLGLVLALVFLTAPARRDQMRVRWFDWLAAVASLAMGLYIVLWYPRIAYTLVFPDWHTWGFGLVTIVLVMEACRRVFGLTLCVVAAVFLLYAGFADLAPGVLKTNPISWDRLLTQTFLGSQGILGFVTEIIATIILVYIIFGQLMLASGGAAIFSDLALAAMGRYRGGPAKVSVVGSALFGSISGSAIANIAVVGNVTIPLMKRIGYRPEVAGAVEATASTGGLIMPPVMGALAFFIAEYLEISYGEVIVAAVIPALLYYGAILVQVDLEAGRQGMKGLPAAEIPSVASVLKPNWPFLTPIAVLIVLLVGYHWSPTLAGMAAVAITGLIAVLRGHGRTLGWWLDVLERSGRSAAEIVAAGALVGIIIVAADITGLAYSISFPLIRLGQENFPLFLVITALTSIVLGMGLPGIVVYIVQAALIVPIMVKMGILPLAAHFFIMYFGTFSMITPPVAIASIAAAGLANADPWRTGIEAVKLGAIAFIVPFVFVLSPSLLMQGDPTRILIDFISAAIGVIALGVALRGFLFAPMGIALRLLSACVAAGLIVPVDAFPQAWIANAAAAAAAVLLVLINRRAVKPRYLRF